MAVKFSQEVKDYASAIHRLNCNSNHTDACGWFYGESTRQHDYYNTVRLLESTNLKEFTPEQLHKLADILRPNTKDWREPQPLPERRKLVNLGLAMENKAPICTTKHCIYRKECAQHETAGDYRSEDGLTPSLYKDGNDVFCDRQVVNEDVGNGILIYKNGVFELSEFNRD